MQKENKPRPGLRQLSRQIQSGKLRAEDLAIQCLEKARDSHSVFISVNRDIVEQARAVDTALEGSPRPDTPLSGLPVTLKDLFDMKGERTLAGSKVLQKIATAADHDCDVVAAMRRARMLFLGRTNMSEFAFTGMGLNPHYGTPKSIWDRDTGRLPGGSSSGSAVSVAEGIVPATMGSDTAGSCRTPAAFNGIVGVKPSYGRYSLDGVYPLSPTSDAPGPLAIDVDSCFLLDQVITGAYGGTGPLPELQYLDYGDLKMMVPESGVLDDLDDPVKTGFERALDWLENSGVEIAYRPMPILEQCMEMFSRRSVVGYEAWQHHQSMVEKYGGEYDPFVCQRLKNSGKVTREEQQSRYKEKEKIIAGFNQCLEKEKVDGVLYPTVPCIPPSIAETMNSENTPAINFRCLRNTATANYFDGCAISLPCHVPGEAPVGLMLSLGNGQDDYLYQVAVTVERILDRGRGMGTV